ncbi:MAG: sensor histidine kinase [Lachnospiraceae bacterium]
MSNRRYNILMVGMACGMAIMAICGMLFMMYSYTIRLQSMVGIVYEQDKAAAGELMKLMFSGNDMAKEGVAAAEKLGYTDKAFVILGKNIISCGALLFSALILAAVALIVYCIIRKNKEEGERNALLKHSLNDLVRRTEEQKQYYEDREHQLQVFMENVAHQLKTPLAAVMVNLELMEGEDAAHDERLKDKCIRSIEKMKELLMTLLNTARLQAGKLHFDKEALDVLELVTRLESEYDGVYVEKQDSFIIDGDREWLYQALNNIVTNGLSYGKVLIRMEGGSEILRIEITDEGCGVSESDINAMFDRYYVGENRKNDSTGIGLNLAYMVVKAHGGDIIVHNSDGGGCCIEIILPRYELKNKLNNSASCKTPVRL